MKNKKPKIGVFKYSCCAGCEFQLIYFQKYIMEVFDAAEITYCRMLQSSGTEDGPFDVALIEGAITEQWQTEQLKKVRSISKYLIPIGSCAVCGGIPAIKNNYEEYEIQKRVYDNTSVVHSIKANPINNNDITPTDDQLLVALKWISEKGDNHSHPATQRRRLADNQRR